MSGVEWEGTRQEVWDQIWKSFGCRAKKFGLGPLVSMVYNHCMGYYLKIQFPGVPHLLRQNVGCWDLATPR